MLYRMSRTKYFGPYQPRVLQKFCSQAQILFKAPCMSCRANYIQHIYQKVKCNAQKEQVYWSTGTCSTKYYDATLLINGANPQTPNLLKNLTIENKENAQSYKHLSSVPHQYSSVRRSHTQTPCYYLSVNAACL